MPVYTVLTNEQLAQIVRNWLRVLRILATCRQTGMGCQPAARHLRERGEKQQPTQEGLRVIGENHSMSRRIETKCFLDFADALTTGMIQV